MHCDHRAHYRHSADARGSCQLPTDSERPAVAPFATLDSSRRSEDHRHLHAGADPLLDIVFEAAIIEWRGPAPFYFVAIPVEHLGEVSYAAREASYGWGCVPVAASIAGASFATSLVPKDGGYLLPLKAAVRTQAGIAPGDSICVRMHVARAGA